MAPQFPPLDEPYRTALREAVDFITARYDPLGIVASGTIVRGSPGPSSDLDLYVIHAAPWRQRVQRRFNGVPAEIFVNPPGQVRRYLESQRREGRPITAHMLATGVVVLDRDPVVEDLRRAAREALAQPPDPPAWALRFKRYMIATAFEDGTDVADSDPLSADMILHVAVREMLRYRFLSANRPIPRDKDLLRDLETLAAPLGALARAFYGAETFAGRRVLAGQIADAVIETRGFFEWESDPQDVPD